MREALLNLKNKKLLAMSKNPYCLARVKNIQKMKKAGVLRLTPPCKNIL
jgi:hypothetical protein